MKNLKKIKGDASFRKFYRRKNNNHTSIVVFAKKEKFKNLIVYDSINKILNNNKVLAPKLYQENYDKNSIEIQDFGDETIFKILNRKNVNKLDYFKKIIKVLIKIQLIKERNIKNFKSQKYRIPIYKKEILIKEANLFCDWYVKKNLPKSNQHKFSKKFKEIIQKITLNIKLENKVFVHRDFHVSNLMLVNNQIGVIDSQDALIGNRAYDLASLIDDVRLKTSKLLKKKIYNYYINSQKRLNRYKFKNDFEILSILRNIKIIGIFTRLSSRDKKYYYLKLIPNAWKLIEYRVSNNAVFKDLKLLLDKNFSKKIRQKKWKK